MCGGFATAMMGGRQPARARVGQASQQADEHRRAPIKAIERRREYIHRLPPRVYDGTSRGWERIEIARNDNPLAGNAEIALEIASLVPIHYYDEIGVTNCGRDERSGAKGREVQSALRAEGQCEGRNWPTRADKPRGLDANVRHRALQNSFEVRTPTDVTMTYHQQAARAVHS
jgi:hypothetical protein